MNYKLAGTFAIICAPFLLIDFLTSEQNVNTWKTGLFGFIYMAGWMTSMLALKRMEIFGNTKWAKVAFTIQLGLLSLAQVWNIWVMFGSDYSNILFVILDICWPLSNVWMLVFGISAFKANRLHGWRRYVPLLAGLWFPVTVVPAITMGYFFLAGPYSAFAFALLGYMVYKEATKEDEVRMNVSMA
jgi:hypothetical protein